MRFTRFRFVNHKRLASEIPATRTILLRLDKDNFLADTAGPGVTIQSAKTKAATLAASRCSLTTKYEIAAETQRNAEITPAASAARAFPSFIKRKRKKNQTDAKMISALSAPLRSIQFAPRKTGTRRRMQFNSSPSFLFVPFVFFVVHLFSQAISHLAVWAV